MSKLTSQTTTKYYNLQKYCVRRSGLTESLITNDASRELTRPCLRLCQALRVGLNNLQVVYAFCYRKGTLY